MAAVGSAAAGFTGATSAEAAFTAEAISAAEVIAEVILAEEGIAAVISGEAVIAGAILAAAIGPTASTLADTERTHFVVMRSVVMRSERGPTPHCRRTQALATAPRLATPRPAISLAISQPTPWSIAAETSATTSGTTTITTAIGGTTIRALVRGRLGRWHGLELGHLAGMGGWYGWGNAQPIYYDYGTNITYQGDDVYYGDAPVATADEYYQQADTLAQSNPPNKGADDQWQPLGVFGLAQGDQTSASALFQLATNKSGAIAGNFSDLLTGSTLKVQGAVDRKTQRAAWTVGDNKDTVYDTGIYNLTKDEAPLLVHFGKDRTQQWLLVRMKQPADQKTDDDNAAQ